MFSWSSIYAAFLLARADAPAAAQPAGDDAAGGLGAIFGNPLMPLLVIGIMFYFLLILPERKKRKQLEETLSNLKKNDPVITSGGICGVVVNASPGSKYITVRVDESSNTRLRILRSHVTHVGPHDEAEDKDKEKKD
jgi:preprotein translocase subunit YajC